MRKNRKAIIIVSSVLTGLLILLVASPLMYQKFLRKTDSSESAAIENMLENTHSQTNTTSQGNDSSQNSTSSTGVFESTAKDSTHTLNIGQNTDGSSVEFDVANMLPGDLKRSIFNININHSKSIKLALCFTPDENVSEALKNQMRIKVFIKGVDSPLADVAFEELKEDFCCIYVRPVGNGKSTIVYTIEAYLPATVGNECANQILSGALTWSSLAVDNIPNDGHTVVTSPATGDTSNTLVFLIITLCAFVALLVSLLLRYRKDVQK